MLRREMLKRNLNWESELSKAHKLREHSQDHHISCLTRRLNKWTYHVDLCLVLVQQQKEVNLRWQMKSHDKSNCEWKAQKKMRNPCFVYKIHRVDFLSNSGNSLKADFSASFSTSRTARVRACALFNYKNSNFTNGGWKLCYLLKTFPFF